MTALPLSNTDEVQEQQLVGGVANAGSVVRVGEHVLRPSNRYTPSVHRYLSALRAAGFAGASSPIGVDGDGRERLEFIEGEVPVPPYPQWAQADTALPVYDLAQFARMCVPIDDELSAGRLGWEPADLPARLRLVADSYGLEAHARPELLQHLSTSIEQGGEFVRRRVEAGDANFIKMWNEIGGMERFDRRRAWWSQQREAFAAALH